MTAPSNNLQQPERLSYGDYMRNIRLLKGLAAPPVPPELENPAFLEAIYERAAAADDLGAILAEALPPRAAPEGAAAGELLTREAADRPELVAHFQGSRSSRAPGWLWQRIRADVSRQQAGRRRQARVLRLRVFRVSAVAAAAAVLLLVGAGVWLDLAGPGALPADDFDLDIQVREVDQPHGEPFHPTDRLRLIAGGGR
ncbi:MAG: hypothetical protein ACYST0_10055 [Planctomycetota bacterium]|jgi:hypothetical protein